MGIAAEAETLCRDSHPVHPAHAPRPPGKHRVAEPRTPPLECLPVRSAKRTKLSDGVEEQLSLSASDREGRVPASKGLEARPPSGALRSYSATRRYGPERSWIRGSQ